MLRFPFRPRGRRPGGRPAGGPAEVLESGDLFFFHRPGLASPRSPAGEALEPFFLVMRPEGAGHYRLLTVGKRRPPPPRKQGDPARGGERFSVHIDDVQENPEALSVILGAHPPAGAHPGVPLLPAARSAGEGGYVIARHGDHVHLAYSLRDPYRAGPLQRKLGIEEEASFIAVVRNPEHLESGGPDYPPGLAALFQDRKYHPADPPALLDYPGAEMVLIAVRREVGRELGLRGAAASWTPVAGTVPEEARRPPDETG